MIDQGITNLAKARVDVALAKSETELAQAALERTTEWTNLQDFQSRLQRAREVEKQIDDAVRATALQMFRASGVKSAHPAITIKIFKRFVYDARQALGYAREHIPNALKLDAKAFEKAAQVLRLDFVTIEDDPRPQITSDLSEYV